MTRSKTRAHRVRGLVLVAFVWTGLLVLLGTVLGFAGRSAPHEAAGDSVLFEPGRLPARPETISVSRVDARLGRAAAVLSGLGTQVWCWSPSDWKERVAKFPPPQRGSLTAWRAYTYGNPRLIHLSPEVCAQLTRLTRDRALPGNGESADALAWSVETLAHEAQHVAGISDEVKAECYGMQSIVRAARLLGLTTDEGRHLATVYWRHWYVWLDASYRSPECRNGGRLDLRPAVDVWP